MSLAIKCIDSCHVWVFGVASSTSAMPFALKCSVVDAPDSGVPSAYDSSEVWGQIGSLLCSF